MKCTVCGEEKENQKTKCFRMPFFKYDQETDEMIRYEYYYSYWCKECLEEEK